MNKTQDIVEKLRDPLMSQQLAERYMLEAACEIERLQAVAEAADLVMAKLGAFGEIATDDAAVDALMNALHDWKPVP